MSVPLSSGSPAAVPPSTLVSLSECPTLCPKPASVETADRGYYDSVAATKQAKMKSKSNGRKGYRNKIRGRP